MPTRMIGQQVASAVARTTAQTRSGSVLGGHVRQPAANPRGGRPPSGQLNQHRWHVLVLVVLLTTGVHVGAPQAAAAAPPIPCLENGDTIGGAAAEANLGDGRTDVPDDEGADPGDSEEGIPSNLEPRRERGWRFGIAEDNVEALNGKGFKNLETKVFRFIVPYNACQHSDQIARARRMIDAAKGGGVREIMVTFGHKYGEEGTKPPPGPAYTRPSPRHWGALVGAFVKKFNADVDIWGVANEPNAGRGWLAGSGPNSEGPRTLAGYYKELRKLVAKDKRRDLLVSPEWHDDYGTDGRPKTVRYEGRTVTTVERYIREYLKAKGGFGNFIGWHPYGGVHRTDTASTLDLLKNTPADRPVMITEVGSKIHGKGVPGEPVEILHDEIEQDREVQWLVKTLANVHPRIERVYYYHQRQPGDDWRWDSALERKDGSLRPAWYTYCNHGTHSGWGRSCQDAPLPAGPGPANGSLPLSAE